MPNVLNSEALRAFVRRVANKLPEGPVRTRFERLAFAHLLDNPRNFQPASDEAIASAPEWARAAVARGEELVTFVLDRSASGRLHNVARRLAAACALASMNGAKQPHLTYAISEAQRLVAKIDRANFEIIAAKAHRLARAYLAVEAEENFLPLCDDRIVAATCRRTWRRVTSIAALRAIGREFGNCLARPPHSQYHAERLRCGSHQYWVLRDRDGAPLVAAMADAPKASHFVEVRGPRNTIARGHAADLTCLGAAIGIEHDPPPPPFLTTLLARPLPALCRCPDCVVTAMYLPRAASAP